jgi:hypothetical protein
MAAKMGRPRLPRNVARACLLAARLNPQEYQRILTAIRKSGKSQPDWLRGALLRAADEL